ncbi:MAG: AzlD domain-containing protein [Gammaproteobacteria bacterium]
MTAPVFILLCSLATYLCRFVGVVAAGRVRAESAVFRYATSITYAIIAALILRMLVYPQGLTADSALSSRLIATGAGLLIYFACRRNVAVAAWTAAATFIIMNEQTQ